MRMFCSVFTVMGVLGATEASAANWNEGAIYAPNGIIAQLERGTVVREETCGNWVALVEGGVT